MEQFKNSYRSILRNTDKAINAETNDQLFHCFNLYTKLIIEIDTLINLSFDGLNETQSNEIKNKKAKLYTLRCQLEESLKRISTLIAKEDKKLTSRLLFQISSNCQYCIIDSAGNCSKVSKPGNLEIFKLDNLDEGFIKVGDWIGILMKDSTPILVSKEGILVFMDIVNTQNRISITLPYDTTNKDFQRLIKILSCLALVKYVEDEKLDTPSDTSAPKSTGEVIASHMDKISESVSQGMVTGATKLGELMGKGSDHLCRKMSGCETNEDGTPTSPPPNPNLMKGLDYARRGSHTAVEISSKAIAYLWKGTGYLASKAAPHIRSAADPYIPEDWKQKGADGQLSKTDQVGCVAGAGLRGFVQIFAGLQNAAVVCGRSFTRGASQVVRHRYGDEYAQGTENALYSAGNLGMTAYNAGTFTKTGLLKTTATVSAMELTKEPVLPSNNASVEKHVASS